MEKKVLIIIDKIVYYVTIIKRFFELESGVLTWFETESAPGSNVGKNKLGEINLKGYTVSSQAGYRH